MNRKNPSYHYDYRHLEALFAEVYSPEYLTELLEEGRSLLVDSLRNDDGQSEAVISVYQAMYQLSYALRRTKRVSDGNH